MFQFCGLRYSAVFHTINIRSETDPNQFDQNSYFKTNWTLYSLALADRTQSRSRSHSTSSARAWALWPLSPSTPCYGRAGSRWMRILQRLPYWDFPQFRLAEKGIALLLQEICYFCWHNLFRPFIWHLFHLFIWHNFVHGQRGWTNAQQSS